MNQYICRETFSITGISKKKSKKLIIKEGEVLTADSSGNVYKNDFFLINMNSIIAQYYLKKVE